MRLTPNQHQHRKKRYSSKGFEMGTKKGPGCYATNILGRASQGEDLTVIQKKRGGGKNDCVFEPRADHQSGMKTRSESRDHPTVKRALTGQGRGCSAQVLFREKKG